MQTGAVDATHKVFGIRHHGPGSARSLLKALREFQPDAVLIEGPSEANDMLSLVAHPKLVPPVALLAYAVDKPRQAAYYPYTEFSPEFQAIRYGLENDLPVRFIDLAASHILAVHPVGARGRDPMASIALASGMEDGELWWDSMVEHRQDASDLFEAIHELMAALRESEDAQKDLDPEEPYEGDLIPVPRQQYEQWREATMRQGIRAALAEGKKRIAVVCGAWHAPALSKLGPESKDKAILRGIPKVKTAVTWVPWTNQRMSSWSGYGAGIDSPAYYELLWNTPSEKVTSTWMLRAAWLLREEDLDASPASVIEAVRLAEALAAVRNYHTPGLQELGESAYSVLCQGNSVPMQLIKDALIVGQKLGAIPDETPLIPLHADIAAQQKRLRLKPEASQKQLDLDLRNETDLSRSHLLHRLQLLDIPWGSKEQTGPKKGTFHEYWTVQWQPELVIPIIEASMWGNTVEDAATAKAIDSAASAKSLPVLTALIQEVLLAELPQAVDPVVQRLQDVSAVAHDVADLIAALPALANITRYGSVRRVDSSLVEPLMWSVFARICIGLPAAGMGISEDAASQVVTQLDEVTHVVRTIDQPQMTKDWVDVLVRMADLLNGNMVVTGKAVRLLFDFREIDSKEAALRLGQVSSPGTSAIEAASYIEGFLHGSGAIILHEKELLKIMDEWLCGLSEEDFEKTLPLTRRTFALFEKAVRRQIGQYIVGAQSTHSHRVSSINEERAQLVIPIVRKILGLEPVL